MTLPPGAESLSATLITFDIDWAPDPVIDHAADILVERGVRATWFVTHDSAAVRRLGERPDLFELGIHPNFLPGSSHGSNPEEVLRNCLAMVPGARSMRTHSLVQSTPLHIQLLRDTPVDIDVSLLLPHHRDLLPVEFWWEGRALLRLPFRWEDDVEMQRPAPVWDAAEITSGVQGLNILNFHPIHVYLNSANGGPYESVKRSISRLGSATPDQLDPFVATGPGTGTAFQEVACQLALKGGGLTVSQVRDHWNARGENNAAE